MDEEFYCSFEWVCFGHTGALKGTRERDPVTSEGFSVEPHVRSPGMLAKVNIMRLLCLVELGTPAGRGPTPASAR